MIKRYIVDEDLILKDYLKKIGIFSNIQKEIKKLNGQYLVNDQTVDNWYQLTKGDKLEIDTNYQPSDRLLNIDG